MHVHVHVPWCRQLTTPRRVASVVHLQVGQHVLDLGGPQPEDLQLLELGLQPGDHGSGGPRISDGGDPADLGEERGAHGERQGEQQACLARGRDGVRVRLGVRELGFSWGLVGV